MCVYTLCVCTLFGCFLVEGRVDVVLAIHIYSIQGNLNNSNFMLVGLPKFIWNLSVKQKWLNCVNLHRKYGLYTIGI